MQINIAFIFEIIFCLFVACAAARGSSGEQSLARPGTVGGPTDANLVYTQGYIGDVIGMTGRFSCGSLTNIQCTLTNLVNTAVTWTTGASCNSTTVYCAFPTGQATLHPGTVVSVYFSANEGFRFNAVQNYTYFSAPTFNSASLSPPVALTTNLLTTTITPSQGNFLPPAQSGVSYAVISNDGDTPLAEYITWLSLTSLECPLPLSSFTGMFNFTLVIVGINFQVARPFSAMIYPLPQVTQVTPSTLNAERGGVVTFEGIGFPPLPYSMYACVFGNITVAAWPISSTMATCEAPATAVGSMKVYLQVDNQLFPNFGLVLSYVTEVPSTDKPEESPLLLISLSTCLGFTVLLLILRGAWSIYKTRKYGPLSEEEAKAVLAEWTKNGGGGGNGGGSGGFPTAGQPPPLAGGGGGDVTSPLMMHGDGSDEEHFEDSSRISSIIEKSGGRVQRILFNELKIERRIGVGSFGDVYRGNWKGTPVAIKSLRTMFSSEGGNSLKEFIDEVSTLCKLVHPNVCQFLGVVLDKEMNGIVMELMVHGSLYSFLHAPPPSEFGGASENNNSDELIGLKSPISPFGGGGSSSGVKKTKTKKKKKQKSKNDGGPTSVSNSEHHSESDNDGWGSDGGSASASTGSESEGELPTVFSAVLPSARIQEGFSKYAAASALTATLTPTTPHTTSDSMGSRTTQHSFPRSLGGPDHQKSSHPTWENQNEQNTSYQIEIDSPPASVQVRPLQESSLASRRSGISKSVVINVSEMEKTPLIPHPTVGGGSSGSGDGFATAISNALVNNPFKNPEPDNSRYIGVRSVSIDIPAQAGVSHAHARRVTLQDPSSNGEDGPSAAMLGHTPVAPPPMSPKTPKTIFNRSFFQHRDRVAAAQQPPVQNTVATGQEGTSVPLNSAPTINQRSGRSGSKTTTRDSLSKVTSPVATKSIEHSVHNPEWWTPRRVMRMARDVAAGMSYIHSVAHLIHRDLKSCNLLISENWTIKVTDFGLSKINNLMSAKMTVGVGTPHWMAPEVVLGKKYDEKVDVFSFGIILWEMLTLQLPYEGLSNMAIMWKVSQEKYRPKIPPSVPPAIANLMESCWEHTPAKRPSFETILEIIDDFLENACDQWEYPLDPQPQDPAPQLQAESNNLQHFSNYGSIGPS